MPELDGLRALAVVSVILFHQKVPGFSLGWSGVFLFFVLSGFLITGILLDTQDKHYFKNFYLRRALRIFPIYYITLAIVFAISYFKFDLKPDNWFLFVLYLQNYAQGLSLFSLPPPQLNHTWTLAVEEQFYLLWPLIVWMASRKTLVVICLCIVSLVPLIRYILLAKTGNPALAFTPLPSVADSLCMGSILAIISRGPLRLLMIGRTSLILLLLLTFIVVIEVATHGIENFWNPADYLGPNKSVLLYSCLGGLFACLIAVSISGVVPWLSTLLKVSPLRSIGKVSYGAYLYHWPILLWTDSWQFLLGAWKLPVWILQWILIATAATLSWFIVERPLLRLKTKFS